MEKRYCIECGKGYGYVDSPPAKNCYCGGKLVEGSEIDESLTFVIWDNVEYPTVSC